MFVVVLARGRVGGVVHFSSFRTARPFFSDASSSFLPLPIATRFRAVKPSAPFALPPVRAFTAGGSKKNPARVPPSSSSPPPSSSSPPPSSSSPPLVVELTAANFKQFFSSTKVPVVVDCYADWCEPCKQLTPKLEALVKQFGGSFVLAKLNVDENQQLAQSLQVQSIPAVFAIHQGGIIDSFDGIIPDADLKKFIENVAKAGGYNASQGTLEEAKKLLADGEPVQASKLFRQLVSDKQSEVAALAGLARCALATGDKDDAKRILESILQTHEEAPDDPDVKQLVTMMELLSTSKEVSVKELEAAIAEDPNNLQARFDVAGSYFLNGRHQDAIDQLLEIMKRDKRWNQDLAKNTLMKIFDALGPNEIVTKSRKRFTSLWFL